MKLFKPFALFFLCSVLLLVGCTKNTPLEPTEPTEPTGGTTSPLAGVWADSSGGFVLSFNQDGTFLITDSGINQEKGTWSFDGEYLTMNSQYEWNVSSWIVFSPEEKQKFSLVLADGGSSFVVNAYKRTAGVSGIIGNWEQNYTSWTNGILYFSVNSGANFTASNYELTQDYTPYETGTYTLSGNVLIMNDGGSVSTNLFYEINSSWMIFDRYETAIDDVKYFKQ